ncbi:MAG TPA: adenylyltransferase/cytidyltransferase family protein [bacterium]|jgi:rfaE bifunctional protein nucleotidyltransferase chain/domain|nr:adenylyltransferase/cytidyltransferase family protein [bacterium]
MAEIILKQDGLSVKIAALKAQGKQIVLADGCFDLLHVGHVRYLRAAKALGDILVLALNSDESVKREKGPGRPLLPLEDRLGVLAAFEMVDFLTSFEGDLEPLLSSLKPNIYAKRPGHATKSDPSFAGQVILVKEGMEHTSNKLIHEILRKYGPLPVKDK